MASRSRERLEQAAAEIEGETAVLVADASDLDRLAALPARGRGSARPDRDPGHQHGRPAAGRGARQRAGRVGAGLQIAGAGAAGPDRGGAAGDARAGLGEDRQRRLELGARADSRTGALQLAPDGGRRVLQDAGRRGRRRRESPSTRSPRAASRPTGWPPTGGRGRRWSATLTRVSRLHASGGPRSTATWSPSCARSAPPTSRGR